MPEITELSPGETSPESSAKPAPPTSGKKGWEKPYALPPCQVCGGKGTGFHYGVNTCEPCKVFFRRNLNTIQNKPCRKDARCEIVAGRRSCCSACRFKKCEDVGMSITSIKTGRYTLKKKMTDIQTLQKQRSDMALVALLVEEERKRPSLEKLVTSLIQLQERYAYLWEPPQKKFFEMHQWYIDNFPVEQSVTEDLHKVVPGDQRLTFIAAIMQLSEHCILESVKFAKKLPGYRELPMEDQIVLLQESLADVRIANTYRLMAPSNGKYSQNSFNMMFGPVTGSLSVGVCTRLDDLHLKPEELAVLTAMMVFAPDRDISLKNPEMVSTMYYRLVDTLQWLLKRNHPDDRLIFAKIVAIVTQFRTVNQQCTEALAKLMVQVKAGIVAMPAVMEEVMPRAAMPPRVSTESGIQNASVVPPDSDESFKPGHSD